MDFTTSLNTQNDNLLVKMQKNATKPTSLCYICNSANRIHQKLLIINYLGYQSFHLGQNEEV